MIRIIHWANDGGGPRQFPLNQLPALMQKGAGLTWVDMAQEPPEVCEPILRDVFKFHPLSIYDALHETHAAKLDLWDDYVYLVFHGPDREQDAQGTSNLPELDLFLGKRFLVTHHQEPLSFVETVWEMCQRDPHVLKSGADHLVFWLALEIVRDHFTMLEELEEKINSIEDRIFEGIDRQVPEELFSLKRILLKERANVNPLRDIFNRLALESVPVVDVKDRIFFRDVYEQVSRLDGIVTHLRDLVSSTFDTYLSVVNNRMNDTMRLMAVITTLFLPITFITGFFGMNFFQAAGATETWTGDWVLSLAVGCMLLIPIGMFWWMKRRGLV